MNKRGGTSTTPSACSSSSSHPPSSERDEGIERARSETNDASGLSGSIGAGATTSRCIKLEDALECQVCLDVAVSPIYSCNDGGHILCYICHGKLTVPKKCPSCSSQGFHNNHALERQAQMLEYTMKCANAEAGCKEQVLSTDFKVHLETYCYFRDIKCVLQDCNRNFKFKEYEAHLQQVHAPTGCPTVGMWRRYRIRIPIDADPESHCRVIIFENKPFLFRTKMTDSTFHIWIVTIGDDKEAMQHFIKFSLFGKQKLPMDEASCSWTGPVIPYHDDPATQIEKAKPVFGTIGREVIVSMAEKHDPHYMIEMKVELISMK